MNYALCMMGLFIIGMLNGMHHERDVPGANANNLFSQKKERSVERQQRLDAIEQALLGCLNMLSEQNSLYAELEESIKNDCIFSNNIAVHIIPLTVFSNRRKWEIISEGIDKQ